MARAQGIYKSAPWSVLLGNFRPYSSRVVAMAVALIHDWHYFQLYCARAGPFSTVLKDVKNDGQTEPRSLASPIRSLGYALQPAQ